MIKGLFSLFTSGIIFNPMVLCGVVLGIYCMTSMKSEAINSLFHDYRLYAAALLFSFVYHFLFKRVYDDNQNLDYGTMIGLSVWGLVKFVLAAVLTMSFVVLISF